MSDIHTGRPGTYDAGELQAIFDYADSLNPAMVIMTGDLTHLATADEFTEFVGCKNSLTALNYVTSGNHDGNGGFANYDAAGLAHHFTADYGNFRFVCFESIQLVGEPDYTGQVTANEITWLTMQLQGANGKTIIVLSHYSLEWTQAIQPGSGYEEVSSLLQTYGVLAYLSGHNHLNCGSKTVNGVVHVDGASTAFTSGNADGGLMVIDFFIDRIFIEYRRARAPFDAFTSTTTPAYTPVVI